MFVRFPDPFFIGFRLPGPPPRPPPGGQNCYLFDFRHAFYNALFLIRFFNVLGSVFEGFRKDVTSILHVFFVTSRLTARAEKRDLPSVFTVFQAHRCFRYVSKNRKSSNLAASFFKRPSSTRFPSILVWFSIPLGSILEPKTEKNAYRAAT